MSKNFEVLQAPTWNDIEAILGVASRAYLWGPPGLGKTHAAQRVGVGEHVFSITLTEETPAAELRGHYLPDGEAWAWHDGPVVKAMRLGGRLVLNELPHASQDALSFLHPVLEDEATCRFTLPTGEEVRPAPGFTVIATGNAPPTELEPSLADRFPVSINIETVHPDALKGLPPGLRHVARETIHIHGDRAISLRRWLAYAELKGKIGRGRAGYAVLYQRVDELAAAEDVNSADTMEVEIVGKGE